MAVEVKVKLLDHYDRKLPLPNYETKGSAGCDVRASLSLEDRESGVIIKPGQRSLINTGIAMEIPEGYEVQVRPRSGLSFKTGLLVVNSPGTIDCDYRGEVKIILGNFAEHDEVIQHGDRVAQLVISPVTQAVFLESESDLGQTERGAGGFGSTGKQ